MPVNIIQSCETFLYISLIYNIIIHFFKKYVRIKIKDYKILIRMSKLSPKLDEVNVSYACKLKTQVMPEN